MPTSHRPAAVRVAALLLVLCAAAGCGFVNAGSEDDRGATSTPLRVSSPAFRAGGVIPDDYTCTGAGISPPLRWAGVSGDARALALVVDDPDAPGGTFTHWIVVNIDPATTSVGPGAVPTGGSQVAGSNRKAAYAGPCPPSGTHHYRFTVSVLRSPVSVADSGDRAQVLLAIRAKTVASGTLTGTVSAP